jgi:hypothetical protein
LPHRNFLDDCPSALPDSLGNREHLRSKIFGVLDFDPLAVSNDDPAIGGPCPVVIGEPVKGGQYSEFPSMQSKDLSQGDLVPNYDFRGLYSTLLEDWLKLDAPSIVNGQFEKLSFIKS